jgi:hypothetical protein
MSVPARLARWARLLWIEHSQAAGSIAVRDDRTYEAVPFPGCRSSIGRFFTVLDFARRGTSRRYRRIRRFACRRVPIWPHAPLLGALRGRGWPVAPLFKPPWPLVAPLIYFHGRAAINSSLGSLSMVRRTLLNCPVRSVVADCPVCRRLYAVASRPALPRKVN